LRDGRVLVAGGGSNTEDGGYAGPLASTRIYDPATERWVASGSLTSARDSPAATLLSDGRVLVAGGWHQGTDGVVALLSTAELFDPTTGQWTPTGSLSAARSAGAALTLPDGRVLVLGGTDGNSPVEPIERYDPVTGAWSVIGRMPAGSGQTVVLLTDGTVLLAGGFTAGQRDNAPVSSVWRLDPTSGAMRKAAPMPAPRGDAAATLLRDGRVLLAGGVAGLATGRARGAVLADTSSRIPQLTASATIYDPVADRWTTTASLPVPREGGQTVLLDDGTVLVAGGIVKWPEPSTPWCPDVTATAIHFVPAGAETAAR